MSAALCPRHLGASDRLHMGRIQLPRVPPGAVVTRALWAALGAAARSLRVVIERVTHLTSNQIQVRPLTCRGRSRPGSTDVDECSPSATVPDMSTPLHRVSLHIARSAVGRARVCDPLECVRHQNEIVEESCAHCCCINVRHMVSCAFVRVRQTITLSITCRLVRPERDYIRIATLSQRSNR